ncbi:hypothetical protein H5410_036722 [Solanum commersonii]|uniref:Uncharacterized protein n=1 Tax=Solanum commersonii TaxID=4109 RepID=A0A9J5Y629_SOLCO|nr:hypothetical protein H5410_036722 [Solanum commersonii]
MLNDQLVVDVELETTLQHPQHILEEVSDDEIMNVEEEISKNEENESFDDEEWDDNKNETTEEEEWENDGIETSEEEYDRHREHLGSRRPIDPEDIPGSISSALERISHDTHLFSPSFGTADPRAYYPNYRRLAIRRPRPLSAGRISDGTPSPTGTSPQLSAMRIGDSSSEQSDAMANTPPLTQHLVHPGVSSLSTVAPSATLDD